MIDPADHSKLFWCLFKTNATIKGLVTRGRRDLHVLPASTVQGLRLSSAPASSVSSSDVGGMRDNF